MSDLENTPPVGGSDHKGPFDALSIIDVIKQEAKELADAKEVYINIQGYERAGLSIRYELPESGKALSLIGERAMREAKGDKYTTNLYITMDTIGFLAKGFYIRNPDKINEWVELDPENTNRPIGFDSTLCEIIDLKTENPTVRQMIKKLFGGNDIMIFTHGEKLQRWLSDARADVNLEFWDVSGNF